VHEFSVAESIRDVVLEEARRHDARRVLAVTCRMGVMRMIVDEVLRTAFELIAADTILADAKLILETEGVDVSCAACGATTTMYEVPYSCPACDSVRIRCRGGQDFTLLSIEIDQEAANGDPDSPTAGRPKQGERR
jgi:hydrogenase nickel incorporation protein HypA/HybF